MWFRCPLEEAKKMYGRHIDGSAVSVRCPELGGARFSEVSNAIVPSSAIVCFSEVVRYSEGPL